MSKEKLIDLDEDQLMLLEDIIKCHVPDKTVWAYGSRVTWKAEETSDLDLAVFNCDSAKIDDFKETLEESDLLISVDVMDWESIPENFKDNIKGKYVVLQEKPKREGWHEMRLGEVAEINPSERLPKGTKAKKVNMDALIPFTRKISKYATETYKSGSKFRNGDTLLARITPCLENGKTAFVDFLASGEVGFGSTEFIVMREKKGITDKEFLYYFAKSENFRDMAIKSMTGTSGRQRVELDEVIKYKFYLPPLPEQKAIAEVLSSLDDKIDLLHRQNKTLENLAQTLFRQWFVEEADEGWEKATIEDVCQKINSGGTPLTKVSDYYRGNINWYSTKELKDNFLFESTNKITRAGLENSSAKIFPENTIVIAIYAAPTVGRLGILANEAAFNQAACGLVADENKICYEYLYMYLLLSRRELHDIASGSAQQNLNVGIMKAFEIVVPPRMIIEAFKLQVRAMFQKIKSNASQIRTLERLRDTLLPKLMSAKVRVR